MQPPTWQVHVARKAGDVEPGELKPQAVRMSGLDSGFRPGCEELLDSGVPEAFDRL
jgi:hypothetical protein